MSAERPDRFLNKASGSAGFDAFRSGILKENWCFSGMIALYVYESLEIYYQGEFPKYSCGISQSIRQVKELA